MSAGTRLNGIALAAISVGLALAPASAAYGQVRSVTLEEPDAAYGEPFSMISGLRELSDGRVLIADGLEEAIAMLDASLGSATSVGRKGQGPGEHGQPDGLFPWGSGDETLLVDLGNGRLAVISSDGKIGESMPLSREVDGQPFIALPAGTDDSGNLFVQPFGGMRPGGGIPDSAAVVRMSADGSRIDTLAMVKRPDMKQSTSGGSQNRSSIVRPVPLSAQDAWAVARDGSVAIARSGDYHLDWIRPDGSVRRGATVKYEPVRVRAAEKERWLEGLGGGLMVGMTIDNGERRMSFSRGGRGNNSAPDPDEFEWPETMPPFTSGSAVSVSQSGNAWVRRSVRADRPATYDVFGPSGDRIAAVTLPEGRSLVGFGSGAVYLSRTDDLDFEWLERYAIKL